MLIWKDLETTGLDETKGSILEIAMLVTDDDLNEVGRPFVSLVKPLHLRGFEVMDEFVFQMHLRSGLLGEIYDLDQLLRGADPTSCLLPGLPRLGEVERAAIDWLEDQFAPCNCWVPAQEGAGQHHPRCAVFTEWRSLVKEAELAGSSVHFDHQWGRVHMDELAALFSYRHLDASCFNVAARRWGRPIYESRPGIGPDGKPVSDHRGLADIRRSIETMKHYRRRGFTGPETPEGTQWMTDAEVTAAARIALVIERAGLPQEEVSKLHKDFLRLLDAWKTDRAAIGTRA